jgi:hypothetical protein
MTISHNQQTVTVQSLEIQLVAMSRRAEQEQQQIMTKKGET